MRLLLAFSLLLTAWGQQSSTGKNSPNIQNVEGPVIVTNEAKTPPNNVTSGENSAIPVKPEPTIAIAQLKAEIELLKAQIDLLNREHYWQLQVCQVPDVVKARQAVQAASVKLEAAKQQK